MLSRLVIAFLSRSKHLLISWLQSPSAVILEPPRIKSVTVSTCARDHGGCSPHANCTTVAPGQRTCTCLHGYTGDGELCRGEAG